ncbi:MAG TPA: Rieske 2Fe-2S domain-containing protein [Acidimicrobiales bacterium]|jgi:thiosulfate dehydrogenase [quinone] large subunit|nr:Rieske 2Fe-2S domain-containing protein [Acidimicrobiales bacterium]
MWSLTGPDGTVAAGWLLIPLRLFLGITFLFAGLQKLANPEFFNTSSASSIHAQLVGASHSSPIHGLASHLVPLASTVGLLISIGEVAIGLGVLVGLLTRVAAVAGMALSLGLFLTVSFHASPYFTGSDIVFFFAWTPFVLGGAAGAPAFDTWLAQRQPVAPSPKGALPRRAVLSHGALAAVAAGVVVLTGGLAALLGRAVGGTAASASGTRTLTRGGPGSTSTTSPAGPSGSTTSTTSPAGPSGSTTPTTGSTPAGTAIGSASSVPVGGSASFTDPSSGDPALVIQRVADDFVAFDAICPHAGCTVAYQESARIIACPCHGSTFDPRTGNVRNGPATSGLTAIKVIRGSNGNLYVTN